MDRLTRLRERKGYSQRALAKESGVSPATIYELENGRRRPNPSTLRKLAGALNVEVVELLEADYPKASATSPQPSFNDFLEEGRREDVYEPWAEFVNSFVDRWERKINEGVLDHGSVMEFTDIVGDLMPVLGPLAREEKYEKPAESPDSFGPVAGAATHRLLDLFNPLIEAAAKLGEDSDLARLRQRREQMASEQVRAASG